MDRKNFCMIFFTFLLITVVFSACKIHSVHTVTISEFNLADYQWSIEKFPYKGKVEPIYSAEKAIYTANNLWLSKFGEDAVYKENEVEVLYDFEHDCWLVKGLLPPNTLGGSPNFLCKKDGEILAIWHEM